MGGAVVNGPDPGRETAVGGREAAFCEGFEGPAEVLAPVAGIVGGLRAGFLPDTRGFVLGRGRLGPGAVPFGVRPVRPKGEGAEGVALILPAVASQSSALLRCLWEVICDAQRRARARLLAEVLATGCGQAIDRTVAGVRYYRSTHARHRMSEA